MEQKEAVAQPNLSAKNVAEFLLALSQPEEGDIISNLKLQKLVYYAYGYFYALYDRPLFTEKIMAWEHGPVIEELYHEYKQFGSGAIPKPEKFDASVFSKEQSDLFCEVYEVLGQFSGWKLRNMTHAEEPWVNTEKGEEIKPQLMADFFRTQIKK